MSRLVWVGIGAAGGIYAYRKGQRVLDEVRDRGVAGTATLAASTAVHWYGQVKQAAVDAEHRAHGHQGTTVDLTDSAQTRRASRTGAGPWPPPARGG